MPMCTWIYLIIKFFPLVHPYFSESGVVMVYDFARSTRECVRCGFPEYVPDMRAGYDEKSPLTHPDLMTAK